MSQAIQTEQINPRHLRLRVTPFIPAIVVEWRRLRGLTQEELAKAAGLSLSTLKKIEAGRKHGPWLDSLEEICEALDISLEELIAGAARLAIRAQVRG